MSKSIILDVVHKDRYYDYNTRTIMIRGEEDKDCYYDDISITSLSQATESTDADATMMTKKKKATKTTPTAATATATTAVVTGSSRKTIEEKEKEYFQTKCDKYGHKEEPKGKPNPYPPLPACYSKRKESEGQGIKRGNKRGHSVHVSFETEKNKRR